jgi:hypothetical protein
MLTPVFTKSSISDRRFNQLLPHVLPTQQVVPPTEAPEVSQDVFAALAHRDDHIGTDIVERNGMRLKWELAHLASTIPDDPSQRILGDI